MHAVIDVFSCPKRGTEADDGRCCRDFLDKHYPALNSVRMSTWTSDMLKLEDELIATRSCGINIDFFNALVIHDASREVRIYGRNQQFHF